MRVRKLLQQMVLSQKLVQDASSELDRCIEKLKKIHAFALVSPRSTLKSFVVHTLEN